MLLLPPPPPSPQHSVVSVLPMGHVTCHVHPKSCFSLQLKCNNFLGAGCTFFPPLFSRTGTHGLLVNVTFTTFTMGPEWDGGTESRMGSIFLLVSYHWKKSSQQALRSTWNLTEMTTSDYTGKGTQKRLSLNIDCSLTL